ncbi:bile acid:sodium symporter family protein [Hymenobacter weizhouensis]|uniref:bile acid:sodium symporter family protein n=1 Tax=Hymenobacter sp. YIM 151500-1 TaxID=2987689 RepID=UPI0022266AE6|nr:bile acid:sodium symporter family protein [Hymenobacter sp. YIM 151500-1]UYZ63774.1 bile acid:sodium symporter [Hymenobacter sp. YIM 151500-1]
MTAPTTSPAPPPTENRLTAWLRRAGLLDWFLLGLAGAVGLAYVLPEAGSAASPVPWKLVTKGGVALIFFFYGLRLSLEKLRAGLRNWRLHVVVQLITFVAFPLLALAARPFMDAGKAQLLWQSIFFLCTLPSTVSTSVVMVGIAGGNLPAAIFNASISSLLGIVLTPLWASLVLGTGTGPEGHLWGLALDLTWQVVLPVVAGVVLHGRFGGFAERHRQALRTFDQVIILLIVYTSFSESFAEGVFRSFGPADILALGAGMVALYFAVFGAVWGLSRVLGFSREDRIVALFCGSKKSLVHGSVMARLLFPASAATGVLLLPLMLYHALQIVLASIMAQRMGQEHLADSAR